MQNTKNYLGIETGKSIKFENIVSLRKVMTQEEVQPELTKLTNFLESNNVKRTSPMLTTTFNIEMIEGKQFLDMEFLIPIDREIEVPDSYTFKPVFHLVNAIHKQHIGSPNHIQDTYNDLITFIQEHQLHQITSGYNININESEVVLGSTPKIDIYIGINPSTL